MIYYGVMNTDDENRAEDPINYWMIQLLMSKASFVRPAPSNEGVGGGLGRRVTSLHCTDQSPAGKTMSELKLCHANGPKSSWRYHAGL